MLTRMCASTFGLVDEGPPVTCCRFALFGQESGSTPKYVPLVTSLASATGHNLNHHTTRPMNQHMPVLIRLPHGIWVAGMRRVM